MAKRKKTNYTYMKITEDALVDLVLWGYKSGFEDARGILNDLDPLRFMNKEAMVEGIKVLLKTK